MSEGVQNEDENVLALCYVRDLLPFVEWQQIATYREELHAAL